ncbi:hypothetical protein NUACC26_083040 [Scytonema sp. NUACC26]
MCYGLSINFSKKYKLYFFKLFKFQNLLKFIKIIYSLNILVLNYL